MTGTLAVDSSVAIPLLMRNHRQHIAVTEWWAGRRGALSGHALAETYSVLTRVPPPFRADPEDVAHAITARFGPPLLLPPKTAHRIPEILAKRGVFGGAVYDALVALAAIENGCALATRDGRARDTYETLGAEVIVVG